MDRAAIPLSANGPVSAPDSRLCRWRYSGACRRGRTRNARSLESALAEAGLQPGEFDVIATLEKALRPALSPLADPAL